MIMEDTQHRAETEVVVQTRAKQFEFEIVQEFKSLGVRVREDSPTRTDIGARI